MNADEDILQLPHIGLKNRAILPELSGIYYVIDEKFIIWYIGKAKNLRARWAGDSHHRLDQLQKQRKKLFTIYYELVPESLLDATEQQRIEQHSPQLNGTKVKARKLRPTETLLRETLANLAPYSFILGVESARKLDLKFIEDSICRQAYWRVKKAVLPLTVIHICINVSELWIGKNGNSGIRFLNKIFRKRSNYSNNWNFACKDDSKYQFLPPRRLLVNGFVIEVYEIKPEAFELIQYYELIKLANVEMRAVDEDSLVILKNKCLLSHLGVCLATENQDYPYDQLSRKAIERIYPYKQDLVKVIFNEEIDLSKPQVLPTDTRTLRDSNTGLLVRIANIANKKQNLTALLTERGLDLNRYGVNKYLESIPKDDNYVDNIGDKRMIVFIKSFLWNSQNVFWVATTVDTVFWLLLETYLFDFAKLKRDEEEGTAKTVYICTKKIILPATLTVTLNGKWKAAIPFGSKDDMSYNAVVDIITSRLQASGIPKLKFSFTLEDTRGVHIT